MAVDLLYKRVLLWFLDKDLLSAGPFSHKEFVVSALNLARWNEPEFVCLIAQSTWIKAITMFHCSEVMEWDSYNNSCSMVLVFENALNFFFNFGRRSYSLSPILCSLLLFLCGHSFLVYRV